VQQTPEEKKETIAEKCGTFFTILASYV